MSDIFMVPRKHINAEFRRLARRKYETYDDVVQMILKQCERFPSASVAWPTVFKRSGQRIEIGIKVVNCQSKPTSQNYRRKVAHTGRPPAFLAHIRVLSGTNAEMAAMALEIIKVAKEIAESLTVLESTK